MDLRDAHLTPPNDADLLRGVQDDLQHSLNKLRSVRDPSMKVHIAANIQMAQMLCDEAIAEWGKKQAIAVARAMPT